MKTARIKKELTWPAIWLASTIAVVAAGWNNSDAGPRTSGQIKTNAAPQEKPIKLRYYGGPKYPMYPQ
jgi:hypothetical protein